MVYDHGTYYGGFADHLFGRDYVVKSDTVTLQTDNSSRRSQRWIGHSLLYQIITWIPFHVYDWALWEIEYKHFGSCPWCGRQYFIRSKKGRQKLKECCADTKKGLGSKPMSYAVPGGGYGGGFTYDSQRDTVTDSCGRTYTRDN